MSLPRQFLRFSGVGVIAAVAYPANNNIVSDNKIGTRASGLTAPSTGIGNRLRLRLQTAQRTEVFAPYQIRGVGPQTLSQCRDFLQCSGVVAFGQLAQGVNAV